MTSIFNAKNDLKNDDFMTSKRPRVVQPPLDVRSTNRISYLASNVQASKVFYFVVSLYNYIVVQYRTYSVLQHKLHWASNGGRTLDAWPWPCNYLILLRSDVHVQGFGGVGRVLDVGTFSAFSAKNSIFRRFLNSAKNAVLGGVDLWPNLLIGDVQAPKMGAI